MVSCYTRNMVKSILFTRQVRRYQGTYVAVVGGKVVASGTSAKEAFRVAKNLLGRKKVEGVYYIPRKKDLLTALCVFRTSS